MVKGTSSTYRDGGPGPSCTQCVPWTGTLHRALLAHRSCRRSGQQRSTAPGRDRFETQVLRLSTPVAASVTARGAQHAPGQVPSMRCSSTPMATPRPPPPGAAASTPGRAVGVYYASPSPGGASESQDQECRNVLRYASHASTPRAAYLSAAERAYSSDSQRRRASLLYTPGSHR